MTVGAIGRASMLPGLQLGDAVDLAALQSMRGPSAWCSLYTNACDSRHHR